MKYFIVTGSNRGLGFNLVEQLLQPEHCVIAIARSHPDIQSEEAIKNGAKLVKITAGLADTNDIKRASEEAVLAILEDATAVYLINNAATFQPAGLAESMMAEQVSEAFNLNVVAPTVLTAAIIGKFQDAPFVKRIVNLSSGAGKRPIEGWSVYCATKAAIDLYTQTVGKEQDLKAKQASAAGRAFYPVEITAFSPGVIDTGFQEQVRLLDAKDFPNIAQFHALKNQGQLRSPETVASSIISLLLGSGFEQGGLQDIKQFDAQ